VLFLIKFKSRRTKESKRGRRTENKRIEASSQSLYWSGTLEPSEIQTPAFSCFRREKKRNK
jgi:hypothetical protein